MEHRTSNPNSVSNSAAVLNGQQQDVLAQLKVLQSHLNALVADNSGLATSTGPKDEVRLKSAQELSDQMDWLLSLHPSQYSGFLEQAIKV